MKGLQTKLRNSSGIEGTAQGATQAHTMHHIAGLSEEKTKKPISNNTANSSVSTIYESDTDIVTGFHTSSIGTTQTSYLIDSGANVSMTNDKSILQNTQQNIGLK
uniref:Uncharacterized protein n=1 Tax=Spongospora subterranea TaxID=70186 RepID=A0A0H5R1D1_9EUKA|eukprot:CRZ07995.1 hypothetical protein [Spongospora subterranea]